MRVRILVGISGMLLGVARMNDALGGRLMIDASGVIARASDRLRLSFPVAGGRRGTWRA